ncbi:MAG TPA: hypothetical protein VGD75_11370, partial [Bradyrhizobium sp.]
MPTRLSGIKIAITIIAASLLFSSIFSSLASAQPFPAPVRTPRSAVVPANPAAARPATSPSPRAASCHNGLSFDRFLAELKQTAVAAGVS